MADDLRKLLDYIVRTYAVHDELVTIDLEASAVDRGGSLESDKRRALRREADRAEELADAFVRGLSLASDGLVVLDDRNPDEDRMADALIRFLVRHDLAHSRTVETLDAQHYRYRIMINWNRLQAVAASAGVDLDQAIKRARAPHG